MTRAPRARCLLFLVFEVDTNVRRVASELLKHLCMFVSAPTPAVKAWPAIRPAEDFRARRLEKIIVGHDLKAGGAAALASALVWARRSDASLRLIHAVEPRDRATHCSCLQGCQCSIEERVAGAGADLEEIIAQRGMRARRIDYEVRVGNAANELILEACAWHADLLIVGGETAGSFHLFGGTAERLARKSPTLVMITPQPLKALPARIMIASDFSLAARHAATAGVGLAKNLGAQIFFFHALDPTPWYGYPVGEDALGLTWLPPLTAKDVEADWACFLKPLRLQTVPWQVCTEEGRAAETILKYAAEISADLIIMGANGQRDLARLLSASVKQAVVRKTQTAVLTIGRDARQFHVPQIVGKRCVR